MSNYTKFICDLFSESDAGVLLGRIVTEWLSILTVLVLANLVKCVIERVKTPNKKDETEKMLAAMDTGNIRHVEFTSAKVAMSRRKYNIAAQILYDILFAETICAIAVGCPLWFGDGPAYLRVFVVDFLVSAMVALCGVTYCRFKLRDSDEKTPMDMDVDRMLTSMAIYLASTGDQARALERLMEVSHVLDQETIPDEKKRELIDLSNRLFVESEIQRGKALMDAFEEISGNANA